MTSVENKQITGNEKIQGKEQQKEREQQRAIQSMVQKYFPDFSTEAKTEITIQIFKYLKLPKTLEFKGIFSALLNLKKENIDNPKLAQILINFIKKKIEKTILDQTNKTNKTKVLNGKKSPNQITNSLSNNFGKIQKEGNNQKRNTETKQITHLNEQSKKQLIEKTKQLQSSLKPEYQPTQAQITAKVQSLSPETKAKLKSSGLSETDYAKLLASKDSLFSAGDTSQESRDFLDSLKELNQSLGIRDLDQMPNSFSVDKQFFKDNPDLVKHIGESPDFKTLDNSFDLSWLKNFKEVSTFVEKFGDENLKRLKSQISPFFDEEGRLKQLTPEERKIFETFFSSFQAIKQQMTGVSTNMLKAGAMQAPIVALYHYLDQDSIGLENLNQQNKQFGDRTDILTEGEDKILKFSGKIDNKPINFYFNLNTGKLQCDDHLNFNKDQNRISIGETTRTALNIQLPSQQDLITLLQETITPETQQELLKTSSNMQEYHQNLNQLISSTLEGSFNFDPLIRSRISMQTEKNLTSQEFSADFLPPHISSQLQDEKIINNNPQIKKLFQILDFVSENSTSDQLISLRKSFKKLTSLISSRQELEKIADPIIKEQFIKLHESLQNTSTIANRTETMFSFLQIFLKQDFSKNEFNPQTLTKNDIFDFIDLENFLSVANEGITLQQKGGFSHTFSTNITAKREKQENLANAKGIEDIERELNNIAVA
ncbi:MAG: hypothetical protein HG456_001150 [candidate division SR1 bacterium]|nr:hypothetical protein [candidate division SR1 bacterium]